MRWKISLMRRIHRLKRVEYSSRRILHSFTRHMHSLRRVEHGGARMTFGFKRVRLAYAMRTAVVSAVTGVANAMSGVFSRVPIVSNDRRTFFLRCRSSPIAGARSITQELKRHCGSSEQTRRDAGQTCGNLFFDGPFIHQLEASAPRTLYVRGNDRLERARSGTEVCSEVARRVRLLPNGSG